MKKQSQFAGEVNWRNVSNDNDLWRFWQMEVPKKQSQFINVQCYAFSGQRQDEETILQNKANFIGVQMGTTLYSKKDYDSEPCRRLQKNKANRRPLAENPKHEILNPPRETRRWKQDE